MNSSCCNPTLRCHADMLMAYLKKAPAGDDDVLSVCNDLERVADAIVTKNLNPKDNKPSDAICSFEKLTSMQKLLAWCHLTRFGIVQLERAKLFHTWVSASILAVFLESKLLPCSVTDRVCS